MNEQSSKLFLTFSTTPPNQSQGRLRKLISSAAELWSPEFPSKLQLSQLPLTPVHIL